VQVWQGAVRAAGSRPGKLCHMVGGGCSLWGRDPAPQNVWRGRTQARWRARARAGVACRLRFLTLRRPSFFLLLSVCGPGRQPCVGCQGRLFGRALLAPRVRAAGPPYLYTQGRSLDRLPSLYACRVSRRAAHCELLEGYQNPLPLRDTLHRGAPLGTCDARANVATPEPPA